MKKILAVLLFLLFWNSQLWSANGLTGTFYNNTTWSAPSVLTRIDANLDVNWGNGSPDGSINTNNFSAIWTGYLYAPEAAIYTFYVSYDDYVDLTIDGTQLYSNGTWTGGYRTDFTNFRTTTSVTLSKGFHTIQMRFIENGGGAYAQLAWKNNLLIPQQIIPTTNLYTAIPPATITSPNSGNSYTGNVAENTTAVSTVIASDPVGSTITYSLSGVDASKLSITSGGVITFTTPPDFETPTDSGNNNVYNFTVTASNGTLSDTQDFAITVTDVAETLAPLAEYRMDDVSWSGTGAVIDTAGGDNSGTVTGTASTTSTNAKICRSGLFSGGAVNIASLAVPTTTAAKTSVSFWMYWDGTNSVMPFGWQLHDLWFSGSSFGFNTANGDIYGIASSGLSNGWHHVVAIFTNGAVASNQLYIDGINQTLTQRLSSINNTTAVVQSNARIGGWLADNGYRFRTMLDEVKIFKGGLTATQVNSIYTNENSGKNWDGTARICNVDTPPILTISPQSYNEENTTNIVNFPITVSGYAGSSTYYVDVNTSNLTAIAGTDYNATNQRISITSNGTINVPITLYGDTKYDQNKTFQITLSNASTGVTFSGSPATITILNDDPIPTLSINDLNVSEGNITTPLSGLNLTLSNVSNLDTNVTVMTTDYSAFNPTDYTSTPVQVITIPAGQISVSVPGISIIGDTNYSPDKEFLVTLSNPINATLADENATITILNDDYAPTISIPPTFSITEGGSGTKLAIVTVSLSGTSAQTITADFSTSDETATTLGTLTTGGKDYDTLSGTLTFAPGETTKDISITINGDMVYEPDETLNITLSNVQNALSGNLANILTITNDDTLPVLSINNVSSNEGNTSTTPFVFTVTSTGTSAQPFTFSYSTRDGTAKSYPYAPDSFGTTQPYALLYNPGKQDYNTTAGVFTFEPGDTNKTITVNVIGNTIFEPNKVFYVDIVSANGADINPIAKSGKGTIVNDDTSFAGPNVRDFKSVYSNTFNGNVRVFGNTVMVKNATGCTIGTEAACNPGNTTRNNSVDAKFTRIDSSIGAPTTNSSAELSTTFVPTGSTIKWAGLYWQGYLCGDEKSTPSKKPNTLNVKLKRPGDTSYQTLQADNLNWVYFANNGSCNGGTERWYYQGNKDITSIINTTSPQGTYYVGDIVSQTGAPAGGSFGGWSIVVVYENTASEGIKNVVVYDGYMGIGAGADLAQKGVLNSFSTNLDGFITPRKAPISSTFLWFGGEGDVAATGDAISLTKSDNTAISLSNTTNPANDVANSTVTYKNTYVTNRTPNWQNTIGLDIDDFDISSILSPCQSQTKATLTSSGDGYFPGVFAFSTEVAQGTACYNEGAVFNFVSTGKVTDGKDDNSPAYENALLTQISNQGTSSIDLIAKREYQPNGLVSDTKTLLSTPGYKGLVHIDFVPPTPTACDQKIALGSDYNLSFTQGYTNRLPVAVNFPQIDTNLSARVRYLVNESGFAEPWTCDTMSTGCFLEYLVNKRQTTTCTNDCNSSIGATLGGCMACVFDPAKTITTAFPSDPNAAVPVGITDPSKLSRVACSADSFAVRPDRFTITSSKTVIYPGDTFTLTVSAVDATGTLVTAYAPTLNATNFTTAIAGGTVGAMSGFTNGIATITVTAGATVGNFNFTIAEKTPKEYAVNDANDGSGASRFISNGSYTYNVSPILSNLNLMMDECAWSDGVAGVKDSSGNGLHGTSYYANTTASSGNYKSYRGGDFTSSNKARVEINDNLLLRPNKLTAMLWFKPSGSQSNYAGLMLKGSSGNWQSSSKTWNDGYGFYINASSKLCFYINKSASGSVCSTTSIASGTWMHAAATYDGDIINLYINGATTPQATKTYSSTTNLIDFSTGKLYISSTPQITNQFFKGYIDEVHLMDRTLLPTQINGIYANENTGKDLNGVTKTAASCSYSVNLPVTKTPNNLSLLPGESASFILSATSQASSGGTADNVAITDIVPSVLTITSVSSGCSVSGQSVTCSTPSIIVGGSISYTINTVVNSNATSGTYTNTANILSAQTNTGTSSSSVNFTILNNPKFDAFDTANFGNKKLYTRAVGKTATFPIYSLNQAGSAIQSYGASLVGVRVVDAASCPSGGSGAWSDLNLSTGLATFSYTPTRATKNLKLQLATKNSGYSDAMCSSDTYSIRPSKFSVSAATIKAGEELNATALNGGTGYNGNATVLTKLNTSKPECVTQTNFLLDNELIASLSFVADHNNDTMVAKDIGIIDLTLADTSWTLEDKGNGDCDSAITDDSILNGKAGCDINTTIPIVINPYQLTTTRTSFTPSWLYLDSSRTQHVDVNAHITAYDKAGNITKNFSDGCFGSTVPLGFYFNATGTLPTDVNLSLTSTTGSQNIIIEASSPYTTLFNSPYFMISNSSFKNGDANLSMQFNFIRSHTKPINPFTLTLTDIKTTDASVALNNDAINLDNPATFVYGRARTYDITTNEASAPNPIEFEVYSTTSNGYVSGMPQNVLNWYRNINHDSKSVGDVSSAGFSGGTSESSIDLSDIPSDGLQSVIVNSTQDRKIHLDIDPWLWYSSQSAYSYAVGSTCNQHLCFNYNYTDASTGVKGVSSGTFQGSDFQMTPAKNITNKGVKLFR